jgi:O-acetylhomoserine (thiol)-lyase
MTKSNPAFETLCVHAGLEPDSATGSRQLPIHQTASFVFKDADDAADLFALKKFGNVYSRLTNPTVTALETRLAALEGGTGATCTASGHAAQLLALLPLMKSGDEFIASNRLYGGTINQFTHTFKNHFGWNCVFVDMDDAAAVKKAITPKTRLIYAESLANPGGVITDIEMIATIAHEAGLPLIIDNTMASPALCQPLKWGADIVLHSTTKFLTGNGTALGGVMIEGGKFDWKKSGNYPALGSGNPSYQGLNFADTFGGMALTVHGHAVGLRDLGPTQSPMNAFLTMCGMETLPLRMERHASNALKVAEYLEKHPKVSYVTYAGLPSSKYHALAKKYLPKGAGAVFTFGLKGGFDDGVRFMESLKLFSMLANIGDTRSLVIHPASTTHRQLDDVAKTRAGAGPEVVRVSIGIEHIDDIVADLEQALQKVNG